MAQVVARIPSNVKEALINSRINDVSLIGTSSADEISVLAAIQTQSLGVMMSRPCTYI
jgi:hypothetical protein